MTTLEELLRSITVSPLSMSSAGSRAACSGPSADGENWIFEPVDVARARLLADLTDDLGFDDEAVETVVDLLDQVHTLRRQLHQLGMAIGRQPTETREAIAVALKDLHER